MKKSLIVLILVSAIFAISCKQENKAKGEIKVVSPEEMDSLLELDDVQLVDVRTPEEYNEENIPNAQNIDFRSSTFDQDINKLDKNKPVLLYCRSGNRSAQCAEKMIEAGFVKIYDLNGGISKWKHEKKEVEIKS